MSHINTSKIDFSRYENTDSNIGIMKELSRCDTTWWKGLYSNVPRYNSDKDKKIKKQSNLYSYTGVYNNVPRCDNNDEKIK